MAKGPARNMVIEILRWPGEMPGASGGVTRPCPADRAMWTRMKAKVPRMYDNLRRAVTRAVTRAMRRAVKAVGNRTRPAKALAAADAARPAALTPTFLSVQVPARNEPAAVLIATLTSLQRQIGTPAHEVPVIVNYGPAPILLNYPDNAVPDGCVPVHYQGDTETVRTPDRARDLFCLARAGLRRFSVSDHATDGPCNHRRLVLAGWAE